MKDPVIPLERNLYGHPLAGLLWERQFEKVLLKYGWEKVPNWECLFVNREKGLFLSVCVDDIYLAGKKQNRGPTWEILMKDVDLGEPTSFLDHVYLGCTQRKCQTCKDIVEYYRDMFVSKSSAGATENLPYSENLAQTFPHGPVIWNSTQRNAWKDIANWRIKQLNNFQSLDAMLDDHQLKEEEIGSVGELSTVCSQLVLKCLFLARIGRPDILCQ